MSESITRFRGEDDELPLFDSEFPISVVLELLDLDSEDLKFEVTLPTSCLAAGFSTSGKMSEFEVKPAERDDSQTVLTLNFDRDDPNNDEFNFLVEQLGISIDITCTDDNDECVKFVVRYDKDDDELESELERVGHGSADRDRGDRDSSRRSSFSEERR